MGIVSLLDTVLTFTFMIPACIVAGAMLYGLDFLAKQEAAEKQFSPVAASPGMELSLAERWRPEHVAVPPRADADASIAFERSTLAPAERLAEPKPLARRTLCPPREMPLLRSISRSYDSRWLPLVVAWIDASIAARRFPDWR